MKINRHLTAGIVATALALACSTVRTEAQTIITNTYTFTFPTTGPTEPAFNDTTWLYWYNSPGGSTPIITDPTTDASNPTPGANTSSSGSLEVISPLAGYTQNVFFGCFADSGGYNNSVEANTALYSSVSFDILVAPGTPLSSAGNYGTIEVGFVANSGSSWSYNQIDSTLAPSVTQGAVTIPASAATNWFHAVVPIDPTQAYSFGPDIPAIALDLNSYSGNYPLFTTTNWIDNISINGNTAPPPPPPTLSVPTTPIVGLNFIDTTPAGADNRYQIINSNDNSGGLSFAGQSKVTYSWTIKSFPLTTYTTNASVITTNDPAYGYQAHFFIVSGSDSTTTQTIYPDQYDQAADYNLANCIFVTVQSDGNGGGVCNFRYKTNEISGNSMLYNTLSPTNSANVNQWPIMPIGTLDSAPLLGTWSLTFANTTNITITSPSGATTNFSIDPASAALFADPCSILLGAQPNGVWTGGLSQDVVYSNFSLTGTSAAYTDNFTTDTNLNANIWGNFGNDPTGTVLVPPGSAYWVGWSLPALQFGLFDASNLPATGNWKSVPNTMVKVGATEQALVASNSLPNNGTTSAYFAVISNSFSQLVVILPGETFTPGVSPGYSGTPTPTALNGGPYAEENVTVMAVDANFNPISGITDSITLSSTDSGAILPNPASMVAGSVTFNNSNPFLFADSGTWTITATDQTTAGIIGISAPVVVGP